MITEVELQQYLASQKRGGAVLRPDHQFRPYPFLGSPRTRSLRRRRQSLEQKAPLHCKRHPVGHHLSVAPYHLCQQTKLLFYENFKK